MIHQHDAIIIGGGLTGLRAALQIYDAGLKVAIISKVHPLRSHSVAAQGGMNASLGNVIGEGGTNDSWEKHAYDTVKGSDYLADQDAVELMCREAAATVIELEHLGTVWSRLENGKIAQRPFGGAGFPRTCYAADRTGHNLLNTLYEQIVARNIPIYEEFFVTSLVVNEGRCVGCTALEILSGDIHGFRANAVLMATGGFGRIFNKSTNALINTGDGLALALHAGAMLKDMEFVQFHPTTLYGTNILISEGARGEGGILLNCKGERFMKRYAPNSIDLAPRDVIARAIEQETAEGRTCRDGYVQLDLRHLGADRIKERLPGIRQIAIDFAGLDPVNNLLPVQPGQHYSMGGIDVDIHGSTRVSGLFAAGECACVSVHGANRLGGNSLLETVVFGRLTADTIVKKIKNHKEKIPGSESENTGAEGQEIEHIKRSMKDVDAKIEQIFLREKEENFLDIKDKLTGIMYQNFGIFRDGPQMQEGYSYIKELQEQIIQTSPDNRQRDVNQALIRFLELEGMLKLAEVIALGAQARRESRGSHKRTDYPLRDDDEFLKHTIATLDGGIQISYKPVRMGKFEPKEREY